VHFSTFKELNIACKSSIYCGILFTQTSSDLFKSSEISVIILIASVLSNIVEFSGKLVHNGRLV